MPLTEDQLRRIERERLLELEKLLGAAQSSLMLRKGYAEQLGRPDVAEKLLIAHWDVSNAALSVLTAQQLLQRADAISVSRGSVAEDVAG